MRLFAKAALGGSVATAATVTALLVSGVFAGSALVAADPLAPRAAAGGLVSFTDCEDLRDWYVDRALQDVGPYGWGSDQRLYAVPGALSSVEDSVNGLVPLSATVQRSAKSLSQSNSATGTNTQEAAVDEPDTVKTDGRLVVRMSGTSTLVITDATGRTPRELSRVSLPGKEFSGTELLLTGDHVLALATDGGVRIRTGLGGPLQRRNTIGRSPVTATKVFDIDISDPGMPRLGQVASLSGHLVSARQYGDVVRLVTATGRPDLPWFTPGDGISTELAARRNADLVRKTTVEDWLPSATSAGTTEPLLGCDDVMHPRHWAGAETVAVTTFDGDAFAKRSSIGITADAQVAYSSADRLYVASPQAPDSGRFDDDVQPGEPLVLRTAIDRTDLHAFSLDGTSTEYVASGTVAGDVRDRWSLDSYDGVLRVAWTRMSSAGRARNGIITMTEKDGQLTRIGQVRGLGINEQIQAVRWFDDLAVLVTFRQVDPLYTIDLTDPASPQARGELKIPGYSGYLHPLGDDLLLGLGVDATGSGRQTGAQAATFDIADLTAPVRTGQAGFGAGTALPAITDPRGFTWLPDRRTGVTAVDDWASGGRLVGLHVDESGALTVRDLGKVTGGGQTRTLPLAGGRIAVVESDPQRPIRLLSVD